MNLLGISLLLGLVVPGAMQAPSLAAAASRFVPWVRWRPASGVTADFRCLGRKEQAILGVTDTEIVIAIFLKGTKNAPLLLRYSAAARDASQAKLTLESMDYSPDQEIGPLPGFRRSRTCKGLNLADDKIDSAHIYWNHDARRFDDWVR